MRGGGCWYHPFLFTIPYPPPSDRCPHAFICDPSAYHATSAMPPIGKMMQFYGCVDTPPHHSNDNDDFISPTTSSTLPPLFINPLYELPSLHLRCPCCTTSPLQHLCAAASVRFSFLPYSSYRISATTFPSPPPLCLFCSPLQINLYNPRAFAQKISPTILFYTTIYLFHADFSDILFFLQAALIFALWSSILSPCRYSCSTPPRTDQSTPIYIVFHYFPSLRFNWICLLTSALSDLLCSACSISSQLGLI